MLDLGVEWGVIEKRGSFYDPDDQRLAQGREGAKQALRESPSLCSQIEGTIRRQVGLSGLHAAPDDTEDEERAEKEVALAAG